MSVRKSVSAMGAFERWSNILFDATLDLTKRVLCFKASVLSRAERQSDPHEELHGAHGSTRACPSHLQRDHGGQVGSFWMRVHRMGHQYMKQHDASPVTSEHKKHRMAGHCARLDDRFAGSRWVQDFELSRSRSMRDPAEGANRGWLESHSPVCT